MRTLKGIRKEIQLELHKIMAVRALIFGLPGRKANRKWIRWN